MDIFMTGATGYIGSAVARILMEAGHRLTGLARSDEAANKLEERGLHVFKGDMMDRSCVLAGSRDADAAIHAASPGDETNAEADEITVKAVLDVFRETGKCFLYTSGIWVLGATGDIPVDEEMETHPLEMVAWRVGLEHKVRHFAEHGIRSVVIRPGIVYGHGRGIPAMLRPRADGAVPYIGDGSNHWPVVDVEDLARLYLLALEHAPAGSVFQAVAENVLVKDVAEAMREGQNARCTESVPVETARVRLGAFADALVLDQMVSGERARKVLGWRPQAPSLLEDLRSGEYFSQAGLSRFGTNS